ncbi:MAG: hypothetical protein O3A20_09635, partial [Planctomycetota bacterium]|nr:hypothetical protein [Planctomycetota bacterium]
HYDPGTLERMRAEGSLSGAAGLPDDLEQTAAIVAALHRQHVAGRKSVRRAEGGGAGLSPWIATHRAERFGRGPR